MEMFDGFRTKAAVMAWAGGIAIALAITGLYAMAQQARTPAPPGAALIAPAPADLVSKEVADRLDDFVQQQQTLALQAQNIELQITIAKMALSQYVKTIERPGYQVSKSSGVWRYVKAEEAKPVR